MTLEEAIERNGSPDIINTDQWSQFTSEDFTGILILNDIAISMDGKRRWVDNVFVERLWCSVKYEEVYLHTYDDIRTAKKSLGHYIEFYDTERKDQSLGDQTTDRLYYEAVERMAAKMNWKTLIACSNYWGPLLRKVQQRIWGCYRSMDGAKAFCRIRSNLSTCRKQGLTASKALSYLFDGKDPNFMR